MTNDSAFFTSRIKIYVNTKVGFVLFRYYHIKKDPYKMRFLYYALVVIVLFGFKVTLTSRVFSDNGTMQSI